jgi:signal transduction histidine kinase/ActR/RegA family two-component response regulator
MSTDENGPVPDQPSGDETPAERQSMLRQLRDVNEQLVVTSMHAQEVADEAETANRLKDEFLAIVSHELRTPLNAVLGWARLLAGGQLDAARSLKAIHIIERNAKTLTRIIDDLLDVSRIISGRIDLDPLPVDLVAVIQGALDEIRTTAEANAVDLVFTCQTVPDPVPGDALRLQQVVANLLSNAVKFTPSGGRVEVRLGSTESHAEIRVADTGQGIAPEFLPRLFDRFTQADTSTTRRHGGIGLGLAIVKALVEQHGGTVRAESPGAGQGATFTIRIPVLGPLGAEEHWRPRADDAAKSAIRLDGLRVLVAEDDSDTRQVLMLILELAGATVEGAASVREALRVFDGLRPDIVVSDIGMPDEDGYALLRGVRALAADHGGNTPAIALTGYVSPEDGARLLAAGFQMHLRKPVEPSDLVAAVASVAVAGGHRDRK